MTKTEIYEFDVELLQVVTCETEILTAEPDSPTFYNYTLG